MAEKKILSSDAPPSAWKPSYQVRLIPGTLFQIHLESGTLKEGMVGTATTAEFNNFGGKYLEEV